MGGFLKNGGFCMDFVEFFALSGRHGIVSVLARNAANPAVTSGDEFRGFSDGTMATFSTPERLNSAAGTCRKTSQE
jgi:hypothetical protein